MSNSDLAIANLPQTFRETLREKVMAATLDLIPKEVLDGYISREITAFFESEELLTVKETEVVMDNPNFNPAKHSGYGNEREIKLKALAFGSKMTPFRQLVWTLLYTDLRPKLEAVLADEESTVRKELNDWIETTVKVNMAATNRTVFSNLANTMSRSMFHGVLYEAVNMSYMNMRNALGAMGADTSRMPQNPMQQPFQTPTP